MLTQSISSFESELRYLADIQGLSTSQGRHPSTDLRILINDSYRSLRNLVLSFGYTQFVTRGTTTALPTSAVETNERYAVISTPVAVNQIKMVDVRISPDDWRALPECTLLQLREISRRRWRGVADTPRRPIAWCWLQAGTVSGSTFTAGQIAIAPVPTGGDYALWTMNEWTSITSDTDVFLYQNEDWRQWHLFDVMSKVCGARDKNNSAKLDYIFARLNPDILGSPAYNIKAHKPTTSGPRTWIRSGDYNGLGWR